MLLTRVVWFLQIRLFSTLCSKEFSASQSSCRTVAGLKTLAQLLARGRDFSDDKVKKLVSSSAELGKAKKILNVVEKDRSKSLTKPTVLSDTDTWLDVVKRFGFRNVSAVTHSNTSVDGYVPNLAKIL